MRHLLGKEQLQLVADSGNEQHISNLLVGLVGMSAGEAPLVSKAFGQQCAVQLVAEAVKRFKHGPRDQHPQHIANTLWACTQLGLADEEFISAVVSSAPKWLRRSTGFDFTQIATACAQIQYRDEAFLLLLLQLGQHLLQQQGEKPGHSRVLSAADKASVATLCSVSVAKLDMHNLAKPAKDLVVASGVGQQRNTHPSNPWRLYLFHSWLLQHRLLDGKGLSGVLTEQQLQKGEAEVALYGDEIAIAEQI
jgi:hypothetical protein